MLGGNDVGPEDATTPDMLDSAAFVNKYINFVGTLRSYYPSASIVCVTTSAVTDAYPVGLKTLTRMKSYTNAVKAYHNAHGDSKVYYTEMGPPNGSPYGENWHPSNATQKAMADLMIPYVKSLMGW